MIDQPSTTAQSEGFPFHQPVVWEPNPEWVASSNLKRFMDRWKIHSYPELCRRSVEDISWFWDAVLKDLGIRFKQPYSTVVDFRDGKEFPRWCVNGRLNIVESCLDRWVETGFGGRPALCWEGEEGTIRVLSYLDLHREVNRCANALRRLGLGQGDTVGLYMPMTPELAIAFLAVVRIGAILLPLFSGYGASAIATRLNDARAKVLFTADGFFRRGHVIAMKAIADEAIREAPSVTHLVVCRRVGQAGVQWTRGRDLWWHDILEGQPAVATTADTSAEDILMIIYTSGTTGRPKGAVHTHCGFPVKAAQDLSQAMDLKGGETVYWMTDMGWMMGPWLVFGSLLCGACMVFYDGAPDFPDAGRVWKIVERHRVSHLGVSPTLIRSLMRHGAGPIRKHDVSTLRAVGSTGSPWDPHSWMWLFDKVLERQKPVLNYSGGTEISGGILCGNFFTPLKPGAFSGPVPGMDADVVDQNGEPVRGTVGELVIRQPWIGMTRGFWQDRERYLQTYWRRYKDVWWHGDFAAIDEDGLWYILGRSDDTIKVADKRLGPAEIEAVLNGHEAVAESVAIGVPHPVKGQKIVAFCVLREETAPSDDLRAKLMDRVAELLGKPFRPADIRFVAALPKTRNAKVMSRVVRAVYLGEDPGDLTSIEDLQAIEAIRKAR